MNIDTLATDAAKAIRACPKCGGKKYAAETAFEAGKLMTKRLSCTACDFDILEAYRAQAKK